MKSKWKDCRLAGGIGTDFIQLLKEDFPKQLLHIYDKPMIYYPISVLVLGRDILIITSKEHISNYQKLLVNGSDFGINIQYKIQKKHN